MANNGNFFMEVWPIFDIYIDCGHIYVPNGKLLGSTSRPHIGDLVMSLFYYFEVQLHDWSIFGPKMAKHGRLVNVPKWSKRYQNGQPKCFWPFETLLPKVLGPSGTFWTISNKNLFFALRHLRQTLLCPFGAKNSFGQWLYIITWGWTVNTTARKVLV